MVIIIPVIVYIIIIWMAGSSCKYLKTDPSWDQMHTLIHFAILATAQVENV